VHAPSALQSGVAVFAQSATPMHWTQTARATLQCGDGATQPASEVHPALQRSSSGSQIGVDPPQSVLDRHCAQRPVDKQRGADAGQSADDAHATHVAVVALQNGSGAAQSVLLAHCSHAPVMALHCAASRGHAAAPGTEHDAWQL
jgi:hypothetical protein